MDSKTTLMDWLTVERFFYATIVLVGAAIRIAGLADQPLSPLEAMSAWPAWLRAMGLDAPYDAQPASALLYSTQIMTFWLTAGGDGVARLGSVVAGTLLVWLPWLWRNWLGRTTVLVIALLVALDPWLVFFSRHADGATLTLCLFAIALTSLMRLCSGSGRLSHRYWALLAVSGGLLLVSGPLAWSVAPLLLLFVLLYGWPALDEDIAAAERGYLVVLFVGAVLVGSTAWGSNPRGIALVGNSVTQWIAQFGGGLYPLSWPFVRLVADQLLLLILGIGGLLLLQRGVGPQIQGGRRAWATFLMIWIGWGLILLLLPGRTPASLTLLGGALLLAAAHTIATLIERVPAGFDWRMAAIVSFIVAALLISITFWGRILVASPQFSFSTAALWLLLTGSLIGVLIVYALVFDGGAALWLGGVVLTLLLLVGSVSSMVQLNHANRVATPTGFLAVTTHPDVRLLATNIATISAQRVGDPGEMPIQVQMERNADPVLGWYLRDMRRLDWVLAPDLTSGETVPSLAVTQDNSATIAGADDYVGGAYDLRSTWLPSALWATKVVAFDSGESPGLGQRLQQRVNDQWRQRLQPALRWFLYGELSALPASEKVVLWAPMQNQ